MAKIMINPNHKKEKNAWGFLLIDNKKNKFSMKYGRDIVIPDESAKSFLDDKRVIVHLDDGSEMDNKKGPVEPVEPVVDLKKLAKEMKDLTQAQQVKKLKGFGLKAKEIKALHYEADRVAKLVELMQ